MAFEAGGIYTGKVTGITKFGAFVELEPKVVGMVHISEVANAYVENISDFLTVGQEVKVKLLSFGDNGKMCLSIKKAVAEPPRREFTRRPPSNFSAGKTAPEKASDPFEEMMAKFKRSSEERMSDLRKASEVKHSGGRYSAKKR